MTCVAVDEYDGDERDGVSMQLTRKLDAIRHVKEGPGQRRWREPSEAWHEGVADAARVSS